MFYDYYCAHRFSATTWKGDIWFWLSVMVMCCFSLTGQTWPFTWWSALLTAPPSGSPPQHCSVFWSRTTSRCSSHSLVWSCPSLAQSSHQHSWNSCCRMRLQVNEWMHACTFNLWNFIAWKLQLRLLCLVNRSGPDHLGASQGGQPRSREVSRFRSLDFFKCMNRAVFILRSSTC